MGEPISDLYNTTLETMQDIFCIAVYFGELKLLCTSTTGRGEVEYFRERDVGKVEHNFVTKSV